MMKRYFPSTINVAAEGLDVSYLQPLNLEKFEEIVNYSFLD